jgi:mRNA interferase RelE/StbE
MDSTWARRIATKIEHYASDPISLSNQVKQLAREPILRLRVGDYRVLFTEDGVVLQVLKIGHRRDVYR